MSWIVRNIDWILIVSGLATCSMLAMALAPRWATELIFGEEVSGAIANVVARTWGAMIFASGVALVCSAYVPAIRVPVMLLSVAGKLSFSATVLAQDLRGKPAFPMALGDIAIAALFVWYLVNKA